MDLTVCLFYCDFVSQDTIHRIVFLMPGSNFKIFLLSHCQIMLFLLINGSSDAHFPQVNMIL